jgi:transcriptional regulator with XRE-family HTH domain
LNRKRTQSVADWEFRGDVLANARRAAQLTQQELAAAAGVANELRVGLWERGEERPHARFIPVLARRLEISPLALLDGDPERPDLAHLRVAAGLSLREMADRAGLTTMSYHRLERRGASRRGVPDSTVKAIADVLGIPPDQARALIAPDAR